MTKKTVKNKGRFSSMVQKSDKENKFIYKLSNGSFLEFESKVFPTISNPNQLTLFK